jgi:hypothetical protein
VFIAHDLLQLSAWKQPNSFIGRHNDAKERMEQFSTCCARSLQEQHAMPGVVHLY